MSHNYMALVNHSMHIITNTPGGVSWPRLLERVHALGSASRRDKTQVFEHLKNRSTLWNNDADDMSDMIFMLKTEAPVDDAVSEASTTKVSATASAKKERLAKYGSIGVSKVSKVTQPFKPEPVAAKPEESPMNERVVRLPGSKTGIVFGNNNMIDEDDVMLEMAWHVYESGEHGMTLSSLRLSVPEFSDCDENDRRYLTRTMGQRYNIGLYERYTIDGSRTIKVLARRGGTQYTLERPKWFVNFGRKPFQFNTEMLNEVKPQVATFGQVSGNALADQLKSLNAAALFASNAGTEHDEFDEEEDNTGMEVEGRIQPTPADPRDAVSVPASKPMFPDDQIDIPVPDALKNVVVQKPTTEPYPSTYKTVPASEIKAVSNTVSPANESHITLTPELKAAYDDYNSKPGDVASAKVTADGNGVVSREEVSQAADTLRLIAAQLEAHADVSEELRKKKERFDVLMRMARESSIRIQTALDTHNELLDDLQKAANDLSSL